MKNKATNGQRTMTVEQVAQELGISRGLAYELAKTGQLPGVIRLGRRLVISRQAIEKLLETGHAQQ